MTARKAPRTVAMERRKPEFVASWVIPTASAAVSIITTAVMIGISVGGVQERLTAVEMAQKEARQEQSTAREAISSERKELKQDVQNQIAALQTSINALDQKLTALLLANNRGPGR